LSEEAYRWSCSWRLPSPVPSRLGVRAGSGHELGRQLASAGCVEEVGVSEQLCAEVLGDRLLPLALARLQILELEEPPAEDDVTDPEPELEAVTPFVPGRLARDISPDSFADITDAEIVGYAGGVTFAGEVSAEDQRRVWERMTSRDDDDQAARAGLAAKRDAVLAARTGLVTTDEPEDDLAGVPAALTDLAVAIADLQVAHANYELGEGP
jgi:hypothetical protein